MRLHGDPGHRITTPRSRHGRAATAHLMWAGPATPARGKRRVIPALCLAVFTLVWLPLAIAPRNRADWLLENLLTFAAVPVAVASYRKRPLSDAAYVQGTAFMILHTIGSHYTYSEVPAGDWLRDAFGLTRNHYDRLVHFAFGLLMLRPLRELVMRQPERLGPLSAAWLSVAQILACSAAYELIEWVVAAWVDPAAGTAYLGTQGDQWDAQKDMACAAVGAVLAALRELVTARGRAVAAHRHLRAAVGPR